MSISKSWKNWNSDLCLYLCFGNIENPVSLEFIPSLRDLKQEGLRFFYQYFVRLRRTVPLVTIYW